MMEMASFFDHLSLEQCHFDTSHHRLRFAKIGRPTIEKKRSLEPRATINFFISLRRIDLQSVYISLQHCRQHSISNITLVNNGFESWKGHTSSTTIKCKWQPQKEAKRHFHHSLSYSSFNLMLPIHIIHEHTTSYE
jgi:hypothetical protein